MTFLQYLRANRFWLLLLFIALCGVFAAVWYHQGDADRDIRILAYGVLGITAGWLIGNYVAWRKLRKR